MKEVSLYTHLSSHKNVWNNFIKWYDKSLKYMDKLVQEGEYWVVYRYSESWPKCPIFKTKDKAQAQMLLQ